MVPGSGGFLAKIRAICPTASAWANTYPIHYQEAAYLSAKLLDRPEAEQIPFNAKVKQTFNAFMQKFSQCQNMPKRQAWALLYPEFGHTYFFDFYLMNDITYM